MERKQLAAVTPQSGSTSTSIPMTTADAAKFSAGAIIAVDMDYTGQTGYVGTPVAGAYHAPGAYGCGLHAANNF